jgi:hypothetical protein
MSTIKHSVSNSSGLQQPVGGRGGARPNGQSTRGQSVTDTFVPADHQWAADNEQAALDLLRGRVGGRGGARPTGQSTTSGDVSVPAGNQWAVQNENAALELLRQPVGARGIR